MKYLFLTFTLLLFSLSTITYAQNEESETVQDDNIFDKAKKRQGDQIILNIVSSAWTKLPKNVELKPINLSIEAYSMTPLIGKRTNVSLAMGFGVSTANYNINAAPGLDSLKNTILNQLSDSISYKKNKISVTYWDVPLELRFRTTPNEKGRSFKVVAGFKFGVMLSNHRKYKGDNGFNKEIKIKEYNIDHIAKYHYGPFFRMGYGKFTLYGSYMLTPLFEDKKGPEITPFTVGLSLLII